MATVITKKPTSQKHLELILGVWSRTTTFRWKDGSQLTKNIPDHDPEKELKVNNRGGVTYE